jgi:hypothetical protein
MNGENQSLVIHQLVELENNQLKFKAPRKLHNILEEFRAYASRSIKKTKRCQQEER